MDKIKLVSVLSDQREELLRRSHARYADVFYYRDRQWEVDFVAAKNGVVESLVQVSYDISSENTLKREVRGLARGAEKFSCERLTLLNFYERKTLEYDGRKINVVPAAEWLSNL